MKQLNISKTIDPLTIGSALRTARLEAGLRQSDIAGRLSVPQSFVSKYEAGDRSLDVAELIVVCRALRIRASDLVHQIETKLERENET